MKKNGRQFSYFLKMGYFVAFSGIIFLMCIIGVKYKKWLSESETFQIRKIEIQGNELFSDQEILDMGGLNTETDIWQINLNEVQEHIGNHAFIEQVCIERLLPDILRIQVSEKHPVALLHFQEKFLCIDQEGLILPTVSRKQYDLPVISGTFQGVVGVGSRAGGNVLNQGLSFLNLVLQLCPEMYSQISEVIVGRPEGLVLYTNQRTFRIWFGKEGYMRKIFYLKAILVELTAKEELPQVRYIDLRFGDQVVVGKKA